MHEGSIRFFAVKSLKITFSTFFGTFSRDKMLFQQGFRFEYVCAILFREKNIVTALC